MVNWKEQTPEPGDTVRFTLDDRLVIGVYLRRGDGSAQKFWIVDIGARLVWAWDLTTFEVLEKKV